MKTIIKLIFSCCKDGPEKDSPDPEFPLKSPSNYQISSIPEKPTQPMTSNKKSDGEGDITKIKSEKIPLNLLRPSIILSMDGSEHQVVLYEDKPFANRLKKRRVKRKHSKPGCNK
jgi:hypothetical protein